jgi:hypothetical protein
MTPVGFEPAISAGQLPQIHALDRAATGTGTKQFYYLQNLTTICCTVLVIC